MINETLISNFIKENKVIAIDKTELDVYFIVENPNGKYSLYRLWVFIKNPVYILKVSDRTIKTIVNKLLQYRKRGYENFL